MSNRSIIALIVVASVLSLSLPVYKLTHPTRRPVPFRVYAPRTPTVTASPPNVATPGVTPPQAVSHPALARDLAAYRQQYPTHLTRHGPPPAAWRDDAPLVVPPGAKPITYASAGRQLSAWLSDSPLADAPRPAVVYCHGGFWFGSDDWAATQPFRDAGFIVMTPMVRGENGNGGDFECFWGEADDVVAAGRALAAMPGVDPGRVFVSGHSAGGTLATLAVMLPDTPFAMAAPIGATLDERSLVNLQSQPDRDLVVFDPADAHELVGRSPILFTASLRRPIRLFQGDHDGNGRLQQQFVALAKHFHRDAGVTFVPGTHLPSQASAVPHVVDLFRSYIPPANP